MTITKEMGIMEVVQKFPQAAQILTRHGMGCLGCAAAHFETIEAGAAAHGIDIAKLMADLNSITG